MSAEKVWLRFDKKKKDGTVWKLRIQDLPAERIDEAIELRLKYFARDEIVHKATGISKNPEAIEYFRHFLYKRMHDPTYRTMICCEDKGDDVGAIMGTSSMSLATQDFDWGEALERAKNGIPLSFMTKYLVNRSLSLVFRGFPLRALLPRGNNNFALLTMYRDQAGLTKNPEAVELYKQLVLKLMHDPTTRTVICCEDKMDDVGDIIGTSCMALITQHFSWDEVLETVKKSGCEELKKMVEVFYACSQMYQPMKALDLNQYLDDHAILVIPEYRGHGIAEQFLKSRRIMCAALNAPKTGGWMTGHGTQIVAARDGWETAFEVKYDDLARNHGLVFEDAPPTMKYMVASPLKE